MPASPKIVWVEIDCPACEDFPEARCKVCRRTRKLMKSMPVSYEVSVDDGAQ
jgi:hypothetical protein